MIRKRIILRSLPILGLALLLAAVPTALAQGPFGPGDGQGPGFGRGPGAGFGPGDGTCAAAGSARGAFGFPLDRLARYLDLSAEQIAEAQEIFEALRDAAAPIRDGQKALHEELQALLGGDSPDPAQVGAVVLELHANREELGTLRDAAMADFEALLTAEQLERLQQLKDLRRHFGPRRGGPHGGGPGFGPGPGPAA